MNILYVITILGVYILFMLMNKTKKKQNIVAWLAISTILIFCYNIFICLICTFIGIRCTLQNLSICNLITIGLLLAIILKNKKIQKYFIKISDVIFAILLMILVIFIAYTQYDFPLNVKYYTTDGGNHYYFAQQFYQKSTLLYKYTAENNLGVGQLDFRLPGAYVNEGIAFKVFDGIALKTDVFMIFDLFILYISGIIVYFLLKTFAKKNKILQVLAAIFSILYMLGYQLNSMVYGYVYLSFALSIILTFLLVIENYEKEKISNKIALPILAILSFGIFFSYAYFIPIIYISIIINIIVKSIRKKEKIISENNIIKILLLIINPLILGLTYFIILPMAKGIENEISSITVDGLIYKNYITNFLIFIPIFVTNIILLIKNRKNKKASINFSTILFILSILFAIILFIGNKLEKVSEYYFFKAYYIIWPLTIINTYIILSKILQDKYKVLKIVTYVYISAYLITILTSTLVFKYNIGINHIFYHNMEAATNGKYILKRGELELLEKARTYIEDNDLYILTPQKKRKA